jgi:hypothetical protein
MRDAAGERREDPPDEVASIENLLDEVRAAERRGELLEAFDLAKRGLDEFPGNVELANRAVLALARAGSTSEAARRFDEYGLGAVGGEESAALGARIKKDEALAAAGEQRRRLAARAAASYRAIGGSHGSFYPAINAATLSLVAGEPEECRALAAEALALAVASEPQSYYSVATQAEAHLLLGAVEAARDALARTASLHGGDFGAVSTTRRQLRMICAITGASPDLLATLSGPAVVHFCGHRASAPSEDGAYLPSFEPAVASRMATEVAMVAPGYAYGSLAAGGDILWAEALLAHGCELHVVLPFTAEEFVRISVAPAGDAWVPRFRRCLEAATRVSYAGTDADVTDDVPFRYCGEMAMGLALLRARYLDAEAFQLALWDGRPARGEAGTGSDVRTWQLQRRRLIVVYPTGRTAGAGGVEPPVGVRERSDGPQQSTTAGQRLLRAMLFADVRGFSVLEDRQLVTFVNSVLAAFAEVLASYGPEVEYRNTWGDALFAVLTDVGAAAACALDLHDAIANLDLEKLGLPSHLALRLSGHVGPVIPVVDPVIARTSFMGTHVSRTARIEPVTPPGAVYVTEAFAAALELQGAVGFSCDYVGHMPAAKDYGRLRMYRLRRYVSGAERP